MRPRYDELWKGILEEVMKDLLLFVEPGIEKDLDLERGFEFLDKELAEMYPEPEKPSNTRVVDKLVKVFLRDGSERCILLHVEIQGNNEKGFARRMFEYYIRLFSRYGNPVAAIAIFTGKDGKKMPGVYEDRCLWTRALYEYKTLCITDYSDEELKSNMNPFAAVILVAKEALLRLKGSEEETDKRLLAQKLLMANLIKEKLAVYGKAKANAILVFLKNYVAFQLSETNRKFEQKTDEIFEKKHTMGIIEVLAEIREREGRERGEQIGLEKGKEESVRLFLANTEFSPAKIAELVGVSLSLVKKIKKELSAK